MLVVDPRSVSFGAATWADVVSVAIERRAVKSFAEYAGTGPHAVLVDVPEQRVEVTVVQEMLADDMDAPVPGEAASLSFETALNGSSSGRTRVTLSAVVLDVKYTASRKSGSVRTIGLVAVSADGVADPVVVTAL